MAIWDSIFKYAGKGAVGPGVWKPKKTFKGDFN